LWVVGRRPPAKNTPIAIDDGTVPPRGGRS